MDAARREKVKQVLAHYWPLFVLVGVVVYLAAGAIGDRVHTHDVQSGIAKFVASDAALRQSQGTELAASAAYLRGLSLCPTTKCFRAFEVEIVSSRALNSKRDLELAAKWRALAAKIKP